MKQVYQIWKNVTTSLFASEHLRSFVYALFPIKKVLSDLSNYSFCKIFLRIYKMLSRIARTKKYGNIDSHFPLLLFAVKPELTREEYQTSWISASAIPTRIAPSPGRSDSSFSTYWRQMEHFWNTSRWDTSVNGTTNVILRIDSDGPFVFIHHTFSLLPYSSRELMSLVETRHACPHLCTYLINRSQKSLRLPVY